VDYFQTLYLYFSSLSVSSASLWFFQFVSFCQVTSANCYKF